MWVKLPRIRIVLWSYEDLFNYLSEALDEISILVLDNYEVNANYLREALDEISILVVQASYWEALNKIVVFWQLWSFVRSLFTGNLWTTTLHLDTFHWIGGTTQHQSLKVNWIDFWNIQCILMLIHEAHFLFLSSRTMSASMLSHPPVQSKSSWHWNWYGAKLCHVMGLDGIDVWQEPFCAVWDAQGLSIAQQPSGMFVYCLLWSSAQSTGSMEVRCLSTSPLIKFQLSMFLHLLLILWSLWFWLLCLQHSVSHWVKWCVCSPDELIAWASNKGGPDHEEVHASVFKCVIK